MAQTYADNRYVLENTYKKPSVVSSRVRRLMKYGYVREEKKPHSTSFSPDFWLVRPTPRGVLYLKQFNAAEVLRALIRVNRIDCATLWIHNFLKNSGELPEFIAHTHPIIRKAAKARFDVLARDAH